MHDMWTDTDLGLTRDTPVITMNGEVIEYDEMEKFVKWVAKELGLDPKEYGTHSDRHGSVAEMILEGLTLKEIALFGHWKSIDGVEAYANPYNPDLEKFVESPEMYKLERRKQGSSTVLIASHEARKASAPSARKTASERVDRKPKYVYRYNLQS